MRREDRNTCILAFLVWLGAIVFFFGIIASTAPAQAKIKVKPEPDWVAEFERTHRLPNVRIVIIGPRIRPLNDEERAEAIAASLVKAGGYGPKPLAGQIAQLVPLAKASTLNPPSFRLNRMTLPATNSWGPRSGPFVHGWLVTVTFWGTNAYGGVVPGAATYLYTAGTWLKVR